MFECESLLCLLENWPIVLVQEFFITIEILFGDTSGTEMTHFIFNSEEQKR